MKRAEVIVLLLLSALSGVTVAHAGCARPTPLSISGSSAGSGAEFSMGSSITVAGKLGCVDTSPGPGPIVIAVLFVQDDKIVEIGRVTSDEKWNFSAKVSVPDSATAGAALLQVEVVAYAEPQPTQLKGRAQGPGSDRIARELPTPGQMESRATLTVTAPGR